MVRFRGVLPSDLLKALFLLCPHMGKRGRKERKSRERDEEEGEREKRRENSALWCLLIRTLIPWEGPVLMASFPSNDPHLQMPTQWGFELQCVMF